MGLKTIAARWLTLSILATLVVASFSIVLLYHIQESTKKEIRQSLFEKEKTEQIKTTRTIAGKIASDLDSIMLRLGQLATLQTFQKGHFTGSNADAVLDEEYHEMKSLYAVDSIFLLNSKNILVNVSKDNNFTRFTGLDLSSREYVLELVQSKAPVFSNWYIGADSNSRITAVYPIIDKDGGQMIGAVGASVLANPFFSTYGNIYDFRSSQYINVLDRKAVFVASANPAVVGQSFYDDKVQSEFVKHDPVVNAFYGKLLSGKTSDTLFDVGFGERLVTGQPVIVNGKSAYFLAVGIPTNLIYADIDALLASQNSLNFVQWMGLLVAVGLILLILLRLNLHLEKKVSKRTQELAIANTQLMEANEHLKLNEKMQKEFINIAAHELRTPITPILVALHLKQQVKALDGTTQTVLAEGQAEMIERNAKRLEKLANNILAITRIEGKGLDLDKEQVDMNENILHLISDAKTWVPSDKRLQFNFEPYGEPLIVEADKSKLFEVLSNLIRNAIKFTGEDGEEGKITIILGKSEDCKYAIVRISDNGRGIDADVVSRLFQKFAASQEFGGTGLGLYLSKSIVESHSGKIWAENNKDGKGATFSFTLPIKHE